MQLVVHPKRQDENQRHSLLRKLLQTNIITEIFMRAETSLWSSIHFFKSVRFMFCVGSVNILPKAAAEHINVKRTK